MNLKPVVLCADDYAQDAGVSRAVRGLAAAGRLTATSCLVLSPRWREEAAALAPLRGKLDVGLHLDATSPFAALAGHGAGLGAVMARAALRLSRAGEVAHWLEPQFDAFERAWGAPPDHVDGHQHVQQFAGIREALLACIARRYASGERPYLRVSRAARGQADAKACVIAAWGAGALTRGARLRAVPVAGPLSGVYDFRGGQERYARLMARWLAGAEAGTLLMCHPAQGLPSASELEDDPIAHARRAEFAHLDSDAFGRQLEAAGVALVRGGGPRGAYTRRP